MVEDRQREEQSRAAFAQVREEAEMNEHGKRLPEDVRLAHLNGTRQVGRREKKREEKTFINVCCACCVLCAVCCVLCAVCCVLVCVVCVMCDVSCC